MHGLAAGWFHRNLTPRQLAERQKDGATKEEELTEFEGTTLRGAVEEGREHIAGKADAQAATKSVFLKYTALEAERLGASTSDAALFAEGLWKNKRACPCWQMTVHEKTLI